MKISNLSSTQLSVEIIGVNNDKDTVLLQPRGTVTLPDGFRPLNEKQRYLYVHAATATVPQAPIAQSSTESN
jgi:hypothetical protein